MQFIFISVVIRVLAHANKKVVKLNSSILSNCILAPDHYELVGATDLWKIFLQTCAVLSRTVQRIKDAFTLALSKIEVLSSILSEKTVSMEEGWFRLLHDFTLIKSGLGGLLVNR